MISFLNAISEISKGRGLLVIIYKLYCTGIAFIIRLTPMIKLHVIMKSSQVNTLPKAKNKTRSKQNKGMHKCSSVYSERGVPLPVF